MAALLILLPVAVFAGSVTVAAINAYRTADEERLVATARALAAAVDARLSEQITALRVLAGARRLDAEVSPDAFEQRMNPVAEQLRGRIVLFGPLPSLTVLAVSPSADGSAVPTQIPEGISPDISRFIDTIFVQKRPFVSNLVFGPLVKRLVIAVVVPLIRDGYSPRALALTFEPAALRELLADQRLPDGTFAAIADGRQRILAHSLDPEGTEVGRPAPSWVTGAIEGKQSLLVTGPGWGGRQNVYAVERLTQAPDWTVTVAQPVHAQQQSALRAVKWLIAGAIALALGLAAAVWVSRHEALRDARREANALRQGKAEVERLHAGLPAVIFLHQVRPDGSFRILYRGGDMQAVLGWPEGEIAHSTGFAELAGPDGQRLHAEVNRQALQGGSASVAWRARRADGSWGWLHTSLRVIERYPEGGGLIVGYAINISQVVEARAEATSARRELEATLAAAPVAVFRGRTQPDGTLERKFLTRAVETITGWSYAALEPKGALRAILPNGWAQQYLDRRSALKQQESWQSDAQLRRPDGSMMWVRIRMVVHERFDDGTMDVIGYLLDVTAEREAQARALTSARLASLGEMAAGLAHELKQPLAATVFATENAELLLEAGDLEGAKLRLSHIAQQMLRAGKVIDHLRRYSSGPEMQAPPEPVELDQVIDGVRSLIDGALRDSNVVLDVDLGEPPPRVMGDVVALEQVLVNLLSNARDALAERPPGAPRRVRVSVVARSDSRITFTVSDNGGGIAPHVLGRLFEPFVTTKGPDRGSGLGLSLCHGLVKRMGGTIEAANGADGAVFTITLKRAATAPDQEPDTVAANGAREARQ